jgi:hypothetical protein
VCVENRGASLEYCGVVFLVVGREGYGADMCWEVKRGVAESGRATSGGKRIRD